MFCLEVLFILLIAIFFASFLHLWKIVVVVVLFGGKTIKDYFIFFAFISFFLQFSFYSFVRIYFYYFVSSLILGGKEVNERERDGGCE